MGRRLISTPMSDAVVRELVAPPPAGDRMTQTGQQPTDSPARPIHSATRPVFAFLAFTSGSYEGAIIRDMRLANDLHRRGYPVQIYWMMEKNPELVNPKIPQRVLVRGLRYQFKRPSGLLDRLGKLVNLFPAARRRLFLNQHPEYVVRLACNFMRVICDGGRSDPKLLDRLERFLI